MKKITKVFLTGLIVTGLLSTTVLGESVLKQIAVNYDLVKKIVVNNEEKTPPEDMKPFVYEGRTYMSLRYISEALGKDVNWDEATGTITIDDKVQVKESEVSLKVNDGTLKGTLTMPESTQPCPVVLIIAGSGPTDRDCNSAIGFKTNAFKMLANDLAKKGYASVRYDKRGVGASNFITKPENVTFDDFINDSKAWVDQLSQDSRFSKVIVLGHSEGALIGAVTAQKSNVNAFISVSGMGTSYMDTLNRQLSQLPPDLLKESKNIMDELKKGNRVENMSKDLLPLFHPINQTFLISAFKYEPTAEIKKVNVPTLIMQGSTDLQVRVEDANLLKGAKGDAKLVILDGMNHILKQAPSEVNANVATYNDPNLPLMPGFVNNIVTFLKEAVK